MFASVIMSYRAAVYGRCSHIGAVQTEAASFKISHSGEAGEDATGGAGGDQTARNSLTGTREG